MFGPFKSHPILLFYKIDRVGPIFQLNGLDQTRLLVHWISILLDDPNQISPFDTTNNNAEAILGEIKK